MKFSVITTYRVASWLYRHKVPLLPKLLWGLGYLCFNAHIPYTAEIGEGTQLGYGGMGIVIHGRTKIGRNCLIGQQVTIGGKSRHYEVPVIGDNVYIAAGAKVLGPIRVGDGAVIGANAVVVKDVPAHCVVAGVPARIIATDIDVADYR